MQNNTLVVLAEYNTLTEAEITKSILDSAGIMSSIRNEYMSPLLGAMAVQVVVRAEDADRAKVLLHLR